MTLQRSHQSIPLHGNQQQTASMKISTASLTALQIMIRVIGYPFARSVSPNNVGVSTVSPYGSLQRSTFTVDVSQARLPVFILQAPHSRFSRTLRAPAGPRWPLRLVCTQAPTHLSTILYLQRHDAWDVMSELLHLTFSLFFRTSVPTVSPSHDRLFRHTRANSVTSGVKKLLRSDLLVWSFRVVLTG